MSCEALSVRSHAVWLFCCCSYNFHFHSCRHDEELSRKSRKLQLLSFFFRKMLSRSLVMMIIDTQQKKKFAKSLMFELRRGRSRLDVIITMQLNIMEKLNKNVFLTDKINIKSYNINILPGLFIDGFLCPSRWRWINRRVRLPSMINRDESSSMDFRWIDGFLVNFRNFFVLFTSYQIRHLLPIFQIWSFKIHIKIILEIFQNFT